jgi:hypothetical protein
MLYSLIAPPEYKRYGYTTRDTCVLLYATTVVVIVVVLCDALALLPSSLLLRVDLRPNSKNVCVRNLRKRNL